MNSRRQFLGASAAAAVASRTVLGANERIQIGLIGAGGRGMLMQSAFAKNSGNVFVAVCDVDRTRVDEATTKIGGNVATYTDYRRLLERKDIDAVLVATPDHWHAPITVAACEAGKDVYVEKPVSNTIEVGLTMVAAARKHNRVVQVGLQQRSFPHFQDCAKLVRDGVFGRITHVLLSQTGGREVPPEPPQAPPADLDWEAFQGPAPHRHPYTPARQKSWRSFYDYGGGQVTDWGVHLIDFSHWFLNADTKAPILTSASAQYAINRDAPDREQVPSTFVISWQYDDFVMSFTNAVMPDPVFPLWGGYYFGSEGVLHVNRAGYRIRPLRRAKPAAAATSGTGPEPLASKDAFLKSAPDAERESEVFHAENFLQCVRSRRRPACDIEVGFYSSLPALIALLAIRQSRTFTWDTETKTAKPV